MVEILWAAKKRQIGTGIPFLAYVTLGASNTFRWRVVEKHIIGRSSTWDEGTNATFKAARNQAKFTLAEAVHDKKAMRRVMR